MKILFWDTELTPLSVYSWSLWPTNIPITMIQDSQHLLCYGARWLGSKKVEFKSVHHDGKQAMLEGLHAALDQADAVVSWNGASFDSKHVNREFVEAGMSPPSPYKEIDLMRVVKRQFKAPSNKLDYWAQNLGVGKKTSHTGFQLWLDCMAGDEKAWRLMKKYQIQDVNLLVELYEKLLPWIPNHPSVAVYDGVEAGCTNCGSQDLERRGVAYTAASAFQQYRCKSCGKWLRGTSRANGNTIRSV